VSFNFGFCERNLEEPSCYLRCVRAAEYTYSSTDMKHSQVNTLSLRHVFSCIRLSRYHLFLQCTIFNVATHHADVLVDFHQAGTHRLKFVHLLHHNNQSTGPNNCDVLSSDHKPETTFLTHITTPVTSKPSCCHPYQIHSVK